MRKREESYEVRQARRDMEDRYDSEIYEDSDDDVWAEEAHAPRKKKRPGAKRRKRGCLSFLLRKILGLCLVVFGLICLVLPGNGS